MSELEKHLPTTTSSVELCPVSDLEGSAIVIGWWHTAAEAHHSTQMFSARYSYLHHLKARTAVAVACDERNLEQE